MHCQTVEDTLAVAERLALASRCVEGVVIHLSGELGSGKTTFCRGFLHGLGHRGSVKSPTFTVVEPYTIDGRDIYHFDFYRINSLDEVEGIGIRDYLSGAALCLMEWPERLEGRLAEPDLRISLAYSTQEGRDITLEALSANGETVMRKFSAAVGSD